MAQRQNHRGKHPEDRKLFAENQVPTLRRAVADLSFLLTRGYAEDAALKLVGDHYQCDVRQRRAVLRTSCSDDSLQRRATSRIPPDTLEGLAVAIDGYNLLITVESILGGGVLLRGRDGSVRDMASIHGSYRRVEETLPAIGLIGETLEDLRVANSHWIFDSPVSNSGRLRAVVLHEAERRGWNWDVQLANNVGPLLSASTEVVITSDGWILDRAARWSPVIEVVLGRANAEPRVIDLRTTDTE